MKLLYHEAKLASLSYILVRYLAAYEIAHVFTCTGCDTVNTSCHLNPEIIGVVFAYMFHTIKKL